MAAKSRLSHSAGCPRRKSERPGILAPLWFFAIALASPLAAQQGEVSLKIDVVAWGNEIGGLSLKREERNGAITARAFRYSTPVSYSGPAIMEIYKTGDGNVTPQAKPTADDVLHQLSPLQPEPEAAPAGPATPAKQGIALELEKRREKEPNLVALAQIPPNCRRATVLLAPASDNTFIAYVIDDDPSKLPPGQLRVHNLSTHTIAMRIAGQAEAKELKTRESFVTTAANQQFIYELAYQLDGEWKFQESNVIPVIENEQTQMIILRSANQFFRSSDGSTSGYLQIVTLRRSPKALVSSAPSP
jgi:hypothetical protein